MHCRCTNSSWGSACSLIPSQAKWQPRVPPISYSDALYTLSFAAAGLREAYGATGLQRYADAETKLVEFLVR